MRRPLLPCAGTAFKSLTRPVFYVLIIETTPCVSMYVVHFLKKDHPQKTFPRFFQESYEILHEPELNSFVILFIIMVDNKTGIGAASSRGG